MNKEQIKKTFKEILEGTPTDLIKDEFDIKESNLEFVEERELEGELSREIGSANLFLASAFLATVNDISIPAKDKQHIVQLASLWAEMISELKTDNYLREKPNSVRKKFELV